MARRCAAVVSAIRSCLLGAYAIKARWLLTQQAVGEKTNEIKIIPDLLSMLEITGAVVLIDAMGCQKRIAGTTIDAKADYLLTLKDNHKDLCKDVRL
jgi:predicted transposase YbfD/YdcC